jgi:peroxiredoxin Q/BCP
MDDYGAWGPKKFMGKEYIGVHRNSYLINPEGQIVKEYIGVNPKKHAAQIIADLKSLHQE